MPPRFYVPGQHLPGERLELPSDEAEHAVRVLRLNAGAVVGVFDGLGGEFSAVIVAAGRDGVAVELGVQVPARDEAAVAVTLIQAVLKGDKMDDVIRDAVMLGISAIQPIVSERTEVSLTALTRGRRRDRWQRVAISSVKQCGRSVVPVVAEPRRLDEVVVAPDGTLALMCIEPGGSVAGRPIAGLPRTKPPAAQLLLGPEGGWTTSEMVRTTSVATPITLGARTLRADAMALVALTALYTQWGEI